MSADIPTGAVLLALAREALLAQLLEFLPQEKRYLARMIANAMAIAGRELEEGGRLASAERDVLCALLAEVNRKADLISLRRRLAQAIRDGAFDEPSRQAELQRALRAITVLRLRLSNPKLLERP